MMINCKPIYSSQQTIHSNLVGSIRRYQETTFTKPVSAHTAQAFEELNLVLENNKMPLILDSGCGTGDSTKRLAATWPDCFVIGIDKSEVRLARAQSGKDSGSNFTFVRADLFDFWRLAVQSGLKVDRHFVFYPNPWPKSTQLKRRIHGHPAFAQFVQLGTEFEVRSNWKIYVDEFACAFKLWTGIGAAVQEIVPVEPYWTAFERKYVLSKHPIYQFKIVVEPHD